jgi:hypothetical protein
MQAPCFWTHGPPFKSFAKTSGYITLDVFPHSHSGKAYTNILLEKLPQASNVVPSSRTRNSFAEMPNGGRLEHVNQFLVQAPELVSKLYSLMNMEPSMVGAHRSPQFMCLARSSSNPDRNVASSNFLRASSNYGVKDFHA